jgi:hypothetical protein
MKKLYRYHKKDGEWSDEVGAKAVEAVADIRIIKGHGRFTLQIDQGDVSRPRTRLETMVRFQELLSTLKENERIRVRDGDDDLVLLAQRIPTFIETPGNDKIDAVHTFVFRKFEKQVFSLGICVCKKIVGSNTYSQHAFCNAEDYGAGNMLWLQRIARAVVREAKAGRLDVEHVIVGDQIWTKGVGWHTYTGNFHFHVHVDCDPNKGGVPPCAQ